MQNMTKRKTTNQAISEVNWTRRKRPMEIFRTIMTTETKKKMETIVMIIFMLTTWCERILTTILS